MLQEIYAVVSAYMLPISVAVTGLTISAIYEIFFMKGWTMNKRRLVTQRENNGVQLYVKVYNGKIRSRRPANDDAPASSILQRPQDP